MATTVTPAVVKAFEPAFVATADLIIDMMILQATRRIDADTWGDRYDDGVLYLTMHLLAVRERALGSATAASGGAIRGPLTWEQVGTLQRGYGAVSLTDKQATSWTNPWFESTTWGSTYAAMRAEVLPRASRVVP